MEEFNAVKTLIEGSFVIGALFLIYLILKLLTYHYQKKKNGMKDKFNCPFENNGTQKNIGEIVSMVSKIDKETKEITTFMETQANLFEKSHNDIHRKMESLHDTDIRSSEILTQILKAIEKHNDLIYKLLIKEN